MESTVAESSNEVIESNCDLNYVFYNFKKMAHQKMLAELSAAERQRVRALKKLQLEAINLDAEFYNKIYDLERKFHPQYEINFKKRKDIINGHYEPPKEECYYAGPETLNEVEVEEIQLDDDQEKPKGIRNFWLNVFKYASTFCSMVTENDEKALKYLTDVKVVSAPYPDLSYTLEFHFLPNEYFDDEILTKTYSMKCLPDKDYPFSFDGPEIYKSQGCEVHWKPEKDLRYKLIKKKDGQMRKMKAESFFNFFYPPEPLTDVSDPNFDFVNSILETDYEIGHYLKERIVPKAVLYFTGEIDDNHLDSEDSTTSESSLGDEETEHIEDIDDTKP